MLLRASLWPLGMGASILAAYGLACALAASPLFVLQEVTVEVSGRPSPEEIRSMSGIRLGMNLLSLDTEAVSRRLETHRWIQHATVVKQLPDRVLIKVREREPVAVVEIQGDLYYLDREGTVLDRVRPGEPLDFPMMTGLGKDVRDAHRWKGGRDVQQALSLLGALEGFPALGSVSEIHLDRSEGLSFVLEGFPSPVVVGWSDFSAKMRRFGGVFPSLASHSRSIERVDLRFSGQVVIRRGMEGGSPLPSGERTETRAGSETPFHPI
jgi:cell division protein FtsQ